MKLFIVHSTIDTRENRGFWVENAVGTGKQPFSTTGIADRAGQFNEEAAQRVCLAMNQWLDTRPNPSNKFMISPVEEAS